MPEKIDGQGDVESEFVLLRVERDGLPAIRVGAATELGTRTGRTPFKVEIFNGLPFVKVAVAFAQIALEILATQLFGNDEKA